MRLYSPHHNSGIEIGKSLQNWTESDNVTYYRGNSVGLGLGDKVTAQGGYNVKAVMGTSFKGLLGVGYNMSYAANLSYNFGFTSNYSTGR